MSLPLMPGDEPIEVKFKPQEENVPPPAQKESGQYPRGMPPGTIRGRYDFSQGPDPQSVLHGQVRWRAPGTMYVYDASGVRQWTYREEFPDGTLDDGLGRRWIPDPPPAMQFVLNGRTRGRYTLDRDANASMAGQERWLNPRTGELFGTWDARRCDNSGMSEQGDGTWHSPNNMIWEAT